MEYQNQQDLSEVCLAEYLATSRSYYGYLPNLLACLQTQIQVIFNASIPSQLVQLHTNLGTLSSGRLTLPRGALQISHKSTGTPACSTRCDSYATWMPLHNPSCFHTVRSLLWSVVPWIASICRTRFQCVVVVVPLPSEHWWSDPHRFVSLCC